MRRLLLFVSALAAFAAAVVAFAPAVLVNPALERMSRGTLTLAEAEGTIWHGRGILVAGGAGRVPLAWSIDPWPLVHRELRLSLSSHAGGAGTPRGEIAVREHSVIVRNLDVTLPADMLRIAAPRAGLRAAGEVRVISPSLDSTPAAIRGGVDLYWHDARIESASGGVDLGTIVAVLVADGERLGGPVANEGGDVEVRGTVKWQIPGSGDASLLLTPRRTDNSTLARILAVIGTSDGAGWRIAWHADLR